MTSHTHGQVTIKDVLVGSTTCNFFSTFSSVLLIFVFLFTRSSCIVSAGDHIEDFFSVKLYLELKYKYLAEYERAYVLTDSAREI